MIVVDTQVLVYFVTPNPQAGLADRVLARDGQWLAPPLWRSELRNVLAGYIRRRDLTVEAALAAFESAEAIIGFEPVPDTSTIMSLAATSGCSAYDLEFVAVARALGVPLVTNDKQVLAAFPGVAVAPAAFVAA